MSVRPLGLAAAVISLLLPSLAAATSVTLYASGANQTGKLYKDLGSSTVTAVSGNPRLGVDISTLNNFFCPAEYPAAGGSEYRGWVEWTWTTSTIPTSACVTSVSMYLHCSAPSCHGFTINAWTGLYGNLSNQPTVLFGASNFTGMFNLAGAGTPATTQPTYSYWTWVASQCSGTQMQQTATVYGAALTDLQTQISSGAGWFGGILADASQYWSSNPDADDYEYLGLSGGSGSPSAPQLVINYTSCGTNTSTPTATNTPPPSTPTNTIVPPTNTPAPPTPTNTPAPPSPTNTPPPQTNTFTPPPTNTATPVPPTATSSSTAGATFTVTPFPTPSSLPPYFWLDQNAWNPSQKEINAFYAIKDQGDVTILIYNSAGELVRTLVDHAVPVLTERRLAWDATNDIGGACAGGVYIFRAKMPGFSRVLRAGLLR